MNKNFLVEIIPVFYIKFIAILSWADWKPNPPKPWIEKDSGLMSAKGGLMMVTKMVGILSSPQKRTIIFISEKWKFVYTK